MLRSGDVVQIWRTRLIAESCGVPSVAGEAPRFAGAQGHPLAARWGGWRTPLRCVRPETGAHGLESCRGPPDPALDK